jgi:PhnB protein
MMMGILTVIKNRLLYNKLRKSLEGSNPYLAFDNTKEALQYYEEVFGACNIMRVPLHSDLAESFGIDEATLSEKTVHSQFNILGKTIMAADNFRKKNTSCTDLPILLDLPAEDGREIERAKEFWNKLVASNKVIVHSPFEKQFWGGMSGHFTDQYGVSWLLYVQPYNKKAIF